MVFWRLAVLYRDRNTQIMSIKVEFSNGVFKPLEKVDNLPSGAVYTVLSEEELRSLTEDLQWLKASEKSFEFWDNPEDAIYDTL